MSRRSPHRPDLPAADRHLIAAAAARKTVVFKATGVVGTIFAWHVPRQEAEVSVGARHYKHVKRDEFAVLEPQETPG